MMQVRYAGGTFRTGDRITEAVLAYAASIANVNRAVELEVPIRDLDGNDSHVLLTIGPASQLAAEPSLADPEELVDEEFVSTLNAWTEELARTSGVDPKPQASR
jgi:hypothetical protein